MISEFVYCSCCRFFFFYLYIILLVIVDNISECKERWHVIETKTVDIRFHFIRITMTVNWIYTIILFYLCIFFFISFLYIVFQSVESARMKTKQKLKKSALNTILIVCIKYNNKKPINGYQFHFRVFHYVHNNNLWFHYVCFVLFRIKSKWSIIIMLICVML